MTITEKQHEEMIEAAKPLVKWMCENLHPHTTMIVEGNMIQLLEGVAVSHITEFIVD